MKFEDAVWHLKSLGLAAVMPDGKLHPISRKIRKPRGLVPVRVIGDGNMPREHRDAFRRSRAAARSSRQSRKA